MTQSGRRVLRVAEYLRAMAPQRQVPVRSRAPLWRTLLVLGVALVVVSGRDQALGQGGTWIVKAPLPTPRVGLAVGVVNGILYAVGGAVLHVGVGGYKEFLSRVDAYDPSTNLWTTKAPMPTPRVGLTVGVMDGMLYALGGSRSQIGPDLETMDAYDPVRNVWTAKAQMRTRRVLYAVGVAKGTLFAVGGWGVKTGPTGLVEAYDPITNKWTAKASMPTPRVNLGVGVVNDMLYAVGGSCCNPGHGSRILDTVEVYDPTTDTWTAKAPLPTPMARPVVGVANNILYAIGARPGPEFDIPVIVVQAYDLSRNVWTTKAPLPGNRSPLGVGAVNGILYAVGGSSLEKDATSGYSGLKLVVDGITYVFKALP